MKWALSVFMTCVCFTCTAQSANLKRAENNLVDIYNSREKCMPQQFIKCVDSVRRVFFDRLQRTLLLPGADTFSFSGLRALHFSIISTPDKRARFFDWFDGLGEGSVGSVSTVVQYKTPAGRTKTWRSPYGSGSGYSLYYIDSIATLGNGDYLLFQSEPNGVFGGYVIGNCHIGDAGFTIEKEIFEKNDNVFEAEVYLNPARDDLGNQLAYYSYNAQKKELLCTLNGTTTRFVYDGTRFRKVRH